MIEEGSVTTAIESELSRTYHFQDGQMTFAGVRQMIESPSSGVHRLVLESGQRVLVASGWLAVTVEARPGSEWEF